jgi:hypothetical protein
MRTDLYVYISGPMTAKNGFSIERNLADGVDLFLTLMQQGIPAHCPHLNGYPPSCWSALPHEAWIALDRVVLDRCTHVLMMTRWRSSAGAVLEHDYAVSIGVPIAYNLPELLLLIEPKTEAAVAAPAMGTLLQVPLEPPAPRMSLADSPPTTAPASAADASPPPDAPGTPAT